MAFEQHASPQRAIKGLGWFSIGLGLAEIAAPNIMAKLIGIKHNHKNKRILRIYGARELGVGLGILSGSNLSKWLWSRFAGDLLDLSSLAKAMTSPRNSRIKAMAATAVAGVTVADARYAMQVTRAKPERQNRKTTPAITGSITIDRSAEDIYRFWRDFQRLSEILDRLETVDVFDGHRSHWKFALPAGRSVEWDAEITDDQPNSRIVWHSASSSVPHSGEVRFELAAGRRGTNVTVEIRPGVSGTGLSKVIKFVPEQYVNVALHNLKQLMEIGEIVRSDASIHSGMHPACPPEEYPDEGEALGSAASA